LSTYVVKTLAAKQTLALRQASEESACFHSSATIKTRKCIYFSLL